MSTKSLLLVALLALGLFSVSAGLSVWLNQGTPATEAKDKDAADKAGPAAKDEKAADKGAKAPPKADVPSLPEAAPGPALAEARAREEMLERKQARAELVLRDLQAEREAVDGLLRRATTDAGRAAADARDADARAAAAPKAADGTPAPDPDSIKRMAAVYDNMSPEGAAKIMQEMADKGRMDTAARTLAQMQPRKASQVLAFMEPALAAQLLDRIQTLKKPTTPAGTGSNLPPAAPTRAP